MKLCFYESFSMVLFVVVVVAFFSYTYKFQTHFLRPTTTFDVHVCAFYSAHELKRTNGKKLKHLHLFSCRAFLYARVYFMAYVWPNIVT